MQIVSFFLILNPHSLRRPPTSRVPAADLSFFLKRPLLLTEILAVARCFSPPILQLNRMEGDRKPQGAKS